MVLLLTLLTAFQLNVGLSEEAGEVAQNDYTTLYGVKIKQNSIWYKYMRVGGEQRYTLRTNLVSIYDKHFTVLQNTFDMESRGIYREDFTAGLKFNTGNVNHYVTAGIDMEKYVHFLPCFRYGIYYNNNKLSIPLSENNWLNIVIVAINTALSSVLCDWDYTMRGSVLWSGERYGYGLELNNDLYITKVFGFSVSSMYYKFSGDKEYHCAETSVFIRI